MGGMNMRGGVGVWKDECMLTRGDGSRRLSNLFLNVLTEEAETTEAGSLLRSSPPAMVLTLEYLVGVPP